MAAHEAVSEFSRISREELLATMERVQLVTVNQRLARHLLDQNARRHRDAGEIAWRQPSARAWDGWIVSSLQQLGEDHRLLNDAQELHLWEQVIAGELNAEQRQQLQLAATARMARDAHRLLCQYRAAFTPDQASEDHRVFHAWREAWLERINTLDVLDRAACVDLVSQAFRDGRLVPPETLVLAGFDELRPDQQQLATALAELGTRVVRWNGDDGGGGAERLLVACCDVEDEVRRCARWARRCLERGATSIGVVASDLQAYRPLLEDLLLAELAPSALLSGHGGEGLVSFSLGRSLADEGVVAAALLILSLGGSLSFDQVSQLLRSPWIGDLERDTEPRMRAERALREAGEIDWPLRRLQRFPELAKLDGFRQLLNAVARSHPGRGPRPAGEWSVQFRQLLKECGWPGKRGLGSRDFQAVEALLALFGELAALERLGRLLTRVDAVSVFARLAREQAFQVESRQGVVQVLGLLEASGFQFEHLWLLGFHDGAFPPAPRPNPFIPVPLQRRLHMPHADAQRELEFARQVSGRLFTAAPGVIASYPGSSDGGERGPSPLLHGFVPGEPELAPSCDPLARFKPADTTLEELHDARAPAVATAKAVTGGTALLKDQALCPFRAFARHRLRCEALARLDIGLDPLQRGTLVHGLLEQFWRSVAGSEELRAMSPEQRTSALRLGAARALDDLKKRVKRDIPEEVRKIEEDRLVRLGEEWLEIELQRSPFRVRDLEWRHESTLGRLSIRTQVDRIDTLESGGVAIIDYKTGLSDPLQWLEQRLSEPQLPIYASEVGDDQVAAVLFAQVRGGDCRFRGLAARDDDFPKVPDRRLGERLAELGLDLEALLERWRGVLVGIAEDFLAGTARVAPLDGEATCRYCDYPALCRVIERGAGNGEGGDA